jgi:hypothetical protein
MKKKASTSSLAWMLYLTFNIITNALLFVGFFVIGFLTNYALGFGVFEPLIALPASYFGLKYASNYLNKHYVITEKDRIIALVLRAMIIVSVVFVIVQLLITGYLSAGVVQSAIIAVMVIGVFRKFAPAMLQESSPEEMASPEVVEERHVLKRILKTVVVTALGSIFLLVVPFIAYIAVAENFSAIAGAIFLAYFIVVIYLLYLLINKW